MISQVYTMFGQCKADYYATCILVITFRGQIFTNAASEKNTFNFESQLADQMIPGNVLSWLI